ncbi:hypothetical protein [Fulvimonas yonginensis]|uniref:Uncharacterized protein n=1 Tax=Fulvimonas yonginensis TaxID=1495200 RepID=A0ABU8JE91_9GAMM
MSYLALLLLAPWLLILGWAYFAYPKSLPRTAARRAFDWTALLIAAASSVALAKLGFDAAPPPQVGAFGRASGAIWQQVLPALLGYGACVLVLLLALLLRQVVWGRRARQGGSAGR